MLVGLDIRDILIIDHAEILFTNGLNVLTGETGQVNQFFWIVWDLYWAGGVKQK